MISFIICSVDPQRARETEENIRRTSGLAAPEIIIHDNRTLRWGLCRTYNHYSERASGEILCYMHEDVLFRTDDWAPKITGFYAAHPDAGVVGFLGSQYKTAAPSAVGSMPRYQMGSLIQQSPDGTKYHMQRSGEGDFSRVVQVDGLCMFVPKAVWAAHRFDAELFDSFHLYDLDFCIQIAQDFKNYVCHSVVVEHASEGSHNDDWYRYTALFIEKWKDRLPLMCIPMTHREIREAEAYAAYKFYKFVLIHRRTRWLGYAREVFRRDATLLYRIKILKYRLLPPSKGSRSRFT